MDQIEKQRIVALAGKIRGVLGAYGWAERLKVAEDASEVLEDALELANLIAGLDEKGTLNTSEFFDGVLGSQFVVYPLGMTEEASSGLKSYKLALDENRVSPPILITEAYLPQPESTVWKFHSVGHAIQEFDFNRRMGIRRKVTDLGMRLIEEYNRGNRRETPQGTDSGGGGEGQGGSRSDRG